MTAATARSREPASKASQDRRRSSPLRGRVLFVMGLLGLAFILGTFGFIAWEQRSRLIERNDDDLRSSAFFLADHAARLLEITNVTLRQTATLAEEQSWFTLEPSLRLWEQLHAAKQALPYIEDIWLNDASGKLRLTTAHFPTPESNASDQDFFKAHVQSDHGLFVGQVAAGFVTGKPTIIVSRRLENPNGTFRGTVSVTVSKSYFDDYWSRLRLHKRSRIGLVRAEDAKIIVQYPPPDGAMSFAPFDKAAFHRAVVANPEAGIYTADSQGERRIGAYHQIGRFPLYVRVSLPANAYWIPWVGQVQVYGSFALVALLALSALTMLATRQFREQAATAALLESEVALRTGELRQETAALEVLNRTGGALAAELDIGRIVQSVTDAGVELTGAQIGAFFYNASPEDPARMEGEDGRSTLYALSGASREAFAHFQEVRHTPVLGPTLVDGRIVRSDDITADPRYGRNGPFKGTPDGHLPIRSYLAVPIVSRTGTIQGGLLFGHERPGIFAVRAERLVLGLAGQAAIALENSNLHQAAQREIEERKQAQAQQSLLIRELHHRVKNTLATVQAVVGATARSTSSIEDFYKAFVGRIISLANTHSLLTEAVWQTASLREILDKELSPYYEGAGQRIRIEGPAVELPSEAAVPIGMAIHELTTNAAKYGALSMADGRVVVRWTSEVEPEGLRLKLTWSEYGGPPVKTPKRQGFGSRLLHRVLTTQLSAKVDTDFDESGLKVSIDAVLKQVGIMNPGANSAEALLPKDRLNS